MNSVTIKAYAKINLTLHITGVADGYHKLDSICATVDLYDLIIIKKREDRLISITMHGQGSEGIAPESNNAFRAAKLFIETYKTCGADITVHKSIPMGAGLGGSSADAAGTINGLAKLYGIDDREGLKRIADSVGSDTGYMLTGGYARLFGRGNDVHPIASNMSLDVLLAVPDGSVSTAQCYSAFDRLCTVGGDSQAAQNALIAGDKAALCANLNNALTRAATALSPDIAQTVKRLKSLNPLAVNMTGSGSGVYAIFENEQLCAQAKDNYKGSEKLYSLTCGVQLFTS